MKPAAVKLKERLDATVFAVPQIPVISCIDVAVEQDAGLLRDALYRQAFGPVRWVECVQALGARGLPTLVECGPGKVLAGLTKRIAPEMRGLAMFDPASLAEVKTALEA
jgi:[acyl-carrier-protein] S-malonyltransferase